MSNLPVRASLPWPAPSQFSMPRSSEATRSKAPRLGVAVRSLSLALGLAIAGTAAPTLAGESNRAGSTTTGSMADSLIAEASAQPLADGTYLYGQSQTPEEIGSAYMVFEVAQGQVTGAFYMPHSSFDCFSGSLETDRVALTVTDSYDQTTHDYAVAYETDGSVASAGETVAPLGLEGFHRIDSVSENDQRLLSTCKADQGTI